jgi:hypothetical protein
MQSTRTGNTTVLKAVQKGIKPSKDAITKDVAVD